MNTAIIFDMDGVVIDTEPLYTKAEIRLFGEYGVEIPEKDWLLFRGCAEEDFFNLSMQRYQISEDKEVFMAKGREYVRDEFRKGLIFMAGFHDLIERIQQKHRTGLVTASPRHNVNWLCESIHLDKIFKYIVSGAESAHNKPYPDPYLDMMKILAVLPENTVIIEDSLLGLRAALSAGAHVVAKGGSVPDKDLVIAHRTISHLDEITVKFIDELLQESI